MKVIPAHLQLEKVIIKIVLSDYTGCFEKVAPETYWNMFAHSRRL